MDILALKTKYEITDSDLKLIREYGDVIKPKLDEYVTRFYKWMRVLDEYDIFFENERRLHKVQNMQVNYWEQTLSAVVDEEYVESRQKVGSVHASIGLGLPAYFAGMSKSLTILSEELYDGSLTDVKYQKTLMAIAKLVHLDTAIVVETYTEIMQRKLTDQHDAMMEMSTPVTTIWTGVLLLPIVGIVDSKRAADIMHTVLTKINSDRAQVIILDISGVAVIDTAVANHLIKITKAAHLMGCKCTVSGISPAIAQTIVELGIDVTGISSTATIREALSTAFSEIGVQITAKA